MADKSIGDLPKAAALYDNDRMVLEQNGEAKSMEGALLKSYIAPFAQTAEQAAEAAESALEGVREAIENIPEGTATPIVNDLTTGGASMALSAEMGKVLGQRPNPNLLDNWYFGNPVNQRGRTEYTETGYTVDRWKLTNPNGTLSVRDDGIALVGRAGNIWLQEHLENAAELYGKQVTLSVIADGKLYSTTGTVQTEAVSQNIAVCSTGFTNGNIGLYKTAAGGLFVQLHAAKTKTVVYYAVKLELGTQQTLAHQDANGKWVLNEIPTYAEELAKCQRYYQLFTAADKRPSNKRDFRPEMRIDATAANTGTITIDGVTYYYADANL